MTFYTLMYLFTVIISATIVYFDIRDEYRLSYRISLCKIMLGFIIIICPIINLPVSLILLLMLCDDIVIWQL